MIAKIKPSKSGYTAIFERKLNQPVEEIWSWLTDNDKLAQWFPELRVGRLHEGGFMKFDMGDGTFEEMRITDLKIGSVLEYTWGEDRVRFELSSEQADGSRLILKEQLEKWTDHTPKDLAGWHVCLDVIAALAAGHTIFSREEQWKECYQKYIQEINKIKA